MRRRRLRPRPGRRLGAIIVFGLAMVGAATLPGVPGQAASATVNAQGGTNCGGTAPAWDVTEPHIAPGESVTFANCAGTLTPGDHQLNEAFLPGCDNDGNWNGVALPQSTTCIFGSSGTYAFSCTVHPEMTGTVHVDPPAQSPPPPPTIGTNPSPTPPKAKPSPTPSTAPTPSPSPSPSASPTESPTPSPTEDIAALFASPSSAPGSGDNPAPALAGNPGGLGDRLPLLGVALVVVGIVVILGGAVYYFRFFRPSLEEATE